ISPSPSLIALSLWSSQKFNTIQTDNIDAKRECLHQALPERRPAESGERTHGM
ncbi:hypothetical protein GOODEAATRI_027024, partial [Goodea atripinnis]